MNLCGGEKIRMVEKNRKIIFISWTPSGRHTKLFADALKANLFFMPKHFNNTRGVLLLLDYLIKTFKTILIIFKNQPGFVFVQNPPSFSPILIIILSKIFRFKTVIDSHNGAFERPWIKIPLHKWALKQANLVTVHNEIIYQNLISSGKFDGINFHIISSKLSEPVNVSFDKEYEYFIIISSFASDEPIGILLEGVELFLRENPNFKFKVTGNYKRQIEVYNKFKDNTGIEFLGFVDENDYLQLLGNAFGAISVSKRDDVQQFSLMECIGFEVPFISNSNKTNKILFNNKMPLFELQPNEISKSLFYFINMKKELNENIKVLKKELQAKWENDFNNLLIKLNVCK